MSMLTVGTAGIGSDEPPHLRCKTSSVMLAQTLISSFVDTGTLGVAGGPPPERPVPAEVVISIAAPVSLMTGWGSALGSGGISALTFRFAALCSSMRS